MTGDAEILAYVGRQLADVRRRARENGWVWPDQLEAAWLAVRDRQGPPQVVSDVDGAQPLTMTIQAAAGRLRVGKRTAERLVARGELPTVEIGGAVRVRVRDLEAFEAARPVRRRS
jgi:excisionase family DNA binding protein